MTNREWLNSLSDEDLFEAIENICCYIEDELCDGKLSSCHGCQLDWLKKEHKEIKR